MTNNNPPESPETRSNRRTFPGRADQISEVRRFVRTQLGDHHRTADVALAASELTTNAWEHTRSRGTEGTFSVLAELRADDTIRLEVEDAGGPSAFGTYAGGDEGGRGLDIIEALASKWGVDGDHSSRTVWAEFTS